MSSAVLSGEHSVSAAIGRHTYMKHRLIHEADTAEPVN